LEDVLYVKLFMRLSTPKTVAIRFSKFCSIFYLHTFLKNLMTMLICDANLKIFEILRFFRFHQLFANLSQTCDAGGCNITPEPLSPTTVT